jgi:large subunit ribosomal protein L25
VEISALPQDLPEFLELDLSAMNLNETRYLGDIPLPAGVTIPELAHRNPPVVSVHSPRAAEPEPEAVAAAEGAVAAAAATTAAAPATGEAPKKEEAKKEEGKKEAAPKKEASKK